MSTGTEPEPSQTRDVKADIETVAKLGQKIDEKMYSIGRGYYNNIFIVNPGTTPQEIEWRDEHVRTPRNRHEDGSPRLDERATGDMGERERETGEE